MKIYYKQSNIIYRFYVLSVKVIIVDIKANSQILLHFLKIVKNCIFKILSFQLESIIFGDYEYSI